MMLRLLIVLIFLLASCRPKKPAPKDAEATSDLFHDCPSPKAMRVQRTAIAGTSKGALELARAIVTADKTERARLVQSLRPDSLDYAEVFDAEFAKRMEAHAAVRWDADLADLPIAPGPQDDDAYVYALTPERLHKPGSELCGRDYAHTDIEKHFGPNITVYCFHAMHNGRESYGPVVDALVFVRGHWALFPRPASVPASAQGCPPKVETDPTALTVSPRALAPIVPGSPADAKRLLEKFLDPSSDRSALLLALEPSLADYRAAFREPLASTLQKNLEPKWKAFAAGGSPPADHVLPAAGDDVVYVTRATASELLTGENDCPSGARGVASSLRSDVFFYCYAFTTLGLGGLWMDGLLFVRGHWILIPRGYENQK